MSSSTPVTCQIVRPGHTTYAGKQGLSSVEGIAKQTVGSEGLCMHLLTIPARRAGEGAHASLMRRDLMQLSGDTHCWCGEQLEHHRVVRQGEMFYIARRRALSACQSQRRTCLGCHRPHRAQRARKPGAAAGSRRAGRLFAHRGVTAHSGTPTAAARCNEGIGIPGAWRAGVPNRQAARNHLLGTSYRQRYLCIVGFVCAWRRINATLP
jgi:uncharacterized RmlC-like cupin family protein